MKLKAALSEPAAGQAVVKCLSNICFGVFVVAVLILAIIAASYYQPTDPWDQPAKPISMEFEMVKQPTFKPDETLLQTGEDFQAATPAEPPEEPLVLYALAPSTYETSQCSSQQRSINCEDPGVLAAIVAFNRKRFRNLRFFAYRTSVRGEEEDECDVSWRYRYAKERSRRKYRDYRRFSLSVDGNCSYKVEEAGGFHSGINAKPSKLKKSRSGVSNSHSKDVLRPHNRTIVTDELETIEDSLPPPISESDFTRNKYLYYSTGGEHCKEMSHFLWSFLCALGEAKYLNRTFVMDLNLCLSGHNNFDRADEEDKDFRLYFDFVHLKEAASIIEKNQFLAEWNQASSHQNGVSVTKVKDYTVTPMSLGDVQSTIIWRNFDAPEPDNYWYRVCEGETENVIQRPWDLIWKSKRLMDITDSICGKLEWDFDAVHVVRGSKALNKELWPNLDSDTSPEGLIEKLKDKVEEQRYLYIATNEVEPGYFDRLKEKYHVYTLEDFKDLWAENSLWYNETKELMGRPIEFDGYMRVEVDTEVLFRAKKRIETFNDLTNDCRNGVNTC